VNLKGGNMAFLREMKRTDKNGKKYSYWVAVRTYRDKKSGKVKHQIVKTFGRISPKQVEQIKQIQALKNLEKETLVTSWEKIQIGHSYEYLNIQILHKIFQLWDLEKIFDNEKTGLVDWKIIAEILVLNRCLFPNSDYKVRDWYKTTILPNIFKISPSVVNPTRIYRCLDQVYLQQENIQKHLAEKIVSNRMDELSIIFYDITSTYFEGYSCPIAEYGLSRGHRKDKPQIILALAVTKQGFPFYWKVLPGHIRDSKTIIETVNTLKETFKTSKVCLVVDKGMVNQNNLQNIQENNFFYLCTLPKPFFRKLDSFPKELIISLSEKLEIEINKENPDYQKLMAQFSYFTYYSERTYYHVLEETSDVFRYILCFNPEKFAEERKQRTEKIISIESYFKTYNDQLSKAKKLKDKTQIENQIYAYLEKRKATGLFTTKVIKKTNNIYHLQWQINTKKIDLLKLTDGFYCLKTNLPNQIEPSFLVSSYRQRKKVESAFSYLKGFIEIRPLYHQKEERVNAHITICVLAYLLQVTIEYLLKKNGIDMSFQKFISQITSFRAVEVEIKNLKKGEIKLPQIPKEIKSLIETVIPDMFAKPIEKVL
jgi:transposase